MTIHILMFAGGLVILYAGAESLVRGASKLALALGVSATIVGMTVVAYGTSAPELVVGLIAGAEGRPGLVWGNVIGSNIANLALVLGIALLIRPIPNQGRFLQRQTPLLMVVTGLMLVLAWNGVIEAFEGVILILILAIYIFGQVRAELRAVKLRRKDAKAVGVDPVPPPTTGRKVVYGAMVLVGLGALIGGAELMVKGAVAIAEQLGISERIIGIAVVAVGTSLPELAASIVASVRRETDLLLGGLIGSNIFNILIILGVCSAITPIDLGGESFRLDGLFVMGVPALIFAFAVFDNTLRRVYGGALLGLYLIYMVLIWTLG